VRGVQKHHKTKLQRNHNYKKIISNLQKKVDKNLMPIFFRFCFSCYVWYFSARGVGKHHWTYFRKKHLALFFGAAPCSVPVVPWWFPNAHPPPIATQLQELGRRGLLLRNARRFFRQLAIGHLVLLALRSIQYGHTPGTRCMCMCMGTQWEPKGGREKKMTKVTYICRSAETKVVTYFTLFLFLFLFFIDFF
jgi:hypothetical protein